MPALTSGGGGAGDGDGAVGGVADAEGVALNGAAVEGDVVGVVEAVGSGVGGEVHGAAVDDVLVGAGGIPGAGDIEGGGGVGGEGFGAGGEAGVEAAGIVESEGATVDGDAAGHVGGAGENLVPASFLTRVRAPLPLLRAPLKVAPPPAEPTVRVLAPTMFSTVPEPERALMASPSLLRRRNVPAARSMLEASGIWLAAGRRPGGRCLRW